MGIGMAVCKVLMHMYIMYSIAHTFCSSVSCTEVKLSTNDEEGITQQMKTICNSMLGIFLSENIVTRAYSHEQLAVSVPENIYR